MGRKTGPASWKKSKKLNSRLKNVETFIKKTIENKQVNYSITATSMPSSGFETKNFTQVASGAEDGGNLGDAARIGDRITLMNQKWGFNFQGSATDTYNQIRVILVESLDGATILGLSDVLEYSSYSVFGDNVFSSPYKTKASSNKRYKVHMDKCFCISGMATKGGVPPVKVIKKNLKFGKTGRVLEYDGPGNGNPINHKMNLLVITDSVSSAHPTMSYNVRSTYRDA